ncbi:glycosyltransferase family 2 protein [Waterburya agarophytonicola K14]|uniref:Glycosyltransferase family 2 protein n=1 Tax=Waterburya agarophytonicola KI4 TaxID=2874699 RepID=A0A964FHB6_9CYAN|nr:glycosyltransferase family 2 protein [Waterburya agarophytonicola]MCC0177343.1 glycosyltransferase family 2 protein [Waterburya agarophytonicola KI4]
MKPEVSVIIPAYNCEEYIAQALESVFAQTYDNFEIILVDDGSTDSTLKVARSFKDSRLKIVANKQNRGVSSVRNCGIKLAKGNWIALLDSDDWYAPERLENLVKIALQQNADFVADDLFLIRDREQYSWSTLLQENQSRNNFVEIVDAVRFITTDRPSPINAPRNWSFGYTKPLMRREFLLEHNIKYNESINVGEDFILYLECLLNKARFLLVPRPYYYYRTREVSLSTRKPTEYLAQSCEITQSFIDLEKAKFDRDENAIAAMYQNLKIFQKRLAYYRAIEHIKHKKIIHTLIQIIRCPYISIYFTNKLITILENKTLDISPTKENEYVSLTFD